MSTDQFNRPDTTIGVNWADHKGSLILFKVHGVERDIPTVHGDSDAVRADVTIIDGDQAGTEYPDTLVFPIVLQQLIRRHVGALVLGRLGQGSPKPGKSPAWLITEATAADEKAARDHLAKKAPAFASPAQGSPPF